MDCYMLHFFAPNPAAMAWKGHILNPGRKFSFPTQLGRPFLSMIIHANGRPPELRMYAGQTAASHLEVPTITPISGVSFVLARRSIIVRSLRNDYLKQLLSF
jgi:hypothetical protein